MRQRSSRTFFLATAAALAATTASAQTTLISDDFEVDTSADYTVVDDGAPDGTQTFAFDYVAAGMPLAPRSAAGDSGGLHLTANNSIGSADHWTVFHNTMVTAPRYKMTVDVWMNFAGTSGTTEFAHVGVGGDAVTFNSVFTPISGSGAFIAFTGDGGSSSDFRWYRDANNTPPGDTASTTLPNSHPSYLGHGSNASGSFFLSLFPSPPSTIAGSPGNIWTTVEVDVDNVAGVISFRFDGVLTFQGDFANNFDGHVSVGLADVFSSLSGPTNFAVYDNLEVVEVPPSVGTNFCTAVANSTGDAASISATSSGVAADNDVTLNVSQLPNDSNGFFLVSQSMTMVMNPGGSTGNICIASFAIGRYDMSILNSGLDGEVHLSLDLTNTPLQPMGPVSIMSGETWNWQYWYRDMDPATGGATSNFTDGLSVTFL